MFHAYRAHRFEGFRDAGLFLAGVACGVGLGSFLLPRSGPETRRAFKRTFEGGKERATAFARRLKNRDCGAHEVSDPAEVSGGFQTGDDPEAVLAPLENH